jgi:CRP-like cAMP-binding protein
VLNGRLSLNRAVVQLPGRAQRCSVADLKEALPQCPGLTSRMMLHEQTLFAQAQQSAACNVTHDVESRMARWLLRARDLCGSDDLTLTQEYLAEMLGVRRTTVSLTAHTLQEAGLLKYRRGKIHIAKPESLKEVSCECYEVVRLHYDALRDAPSNVV